MMTPVTAIENSFHGKIMDLEFSLFLLFLLAMPFGADSVLSLHVMGFNVTVAQFLLLMIVSVVFMKGCLAGFKVRLVFSVYGVSVMLLFFLSLVPLLYVPGDTILFDIKTSMHFFEAVLLMLISARVVNSIERMDRLVSVMVTGLLVFAVATVLKKFGLPVPGHKRIVFDTIGIGVIGLLTGVMSFSLFVAGGFSMCLKKNIQNKIIHGGCVAIVLYAGFIAYTRSLWLALLVQCGIAFLFQYARTRKWYMKAIAGTVILTLALLLCVYAGDLWALLYSIRPSTVTGRFESIVIGLRIIGSNVHYMLFGMGEGAFLQALFHETHRSVVIHNFLFNLLICKGFFSALCLVACIAWNLVSLNRIRKNIAFPVAFRNYAEMFMLSGIGVCVEGMFSPILSSIIFWSYLSLSCAFIGMAKNTNCQAGVK